MPSVINLTLIEFVGLVSISETILADNGHAKDIITEYYNSGKLVTPPAASTLEETLLQLDNYIFYDTRSQLQVQALV